jgi:quercetin dioxygenase-like cupin family protein
MPQHPGPQSQSPIPDDDPSRSLVVTSLNDEGAIHLSLAGDTYTLLVTGEQTNGRYCLIDMHIPTGGGPPPHRHNFEEMFTLIEGSVDFTFRGETTTVSAGSTVNIPANAPHSFRNTSGTSVRMLCMCAPAGQDAFFQRLGDPVDSSTAPPPPLTDEEATDRKKLAAELAPQYCTEMLT